MLASVLAASIGLGFPNSPAGAEVGFSLVTTHAEAAAQPTQWGREIVELQAWKGKVYAGYGDYGNNTGPIAVSGLDPATGEFATEFTADTEAVFNFRPIGDQLMIPSIDPRLAADYTQDGPWTESTALHASHVFDTVTLTGSDLWMLGSQGSDAVAWRSFDQGTTWTEATRVGPKNAGDFARFYFGAVMGGSLVLQPVDAAAGPQRKSLTFNGSSWRRTASFLDMGELGWRPMTFAGKTVFHARGPGQDANIYSFDGRRRVALARGWDFEISGDTIYVLTSDGTVLSSTDLESWSAVGNAPSNARSIAVLDGTVYVGTADSAVWSLAV